MEVVVRTAGGEAEIRLEVEDPAVTLTAVAVALQGRPPEVVAVDGRAVAVSTPLAAAGVRRGSVIELDPSPRRSVDDTTAPSAVELVTIAGVGTGRRRHLAAGRYDVGPGTGRHELADGAVDEVRWRLRVPEAAHVTRTQLVELADRVVELRPLSGPASAPDRRRSLPGAAATDGTIAFNRPPRALVPGDDRPIAVPDRTLRHDERRSIPLLAMITPLPIAVAMAAVLGSWRYALFGLLSPIMALANAIEDRRGRRRDGRRATRVDRAAAVAVASEIAERHRHALDHARRAHPNLAELLGWMHDHHPRLWERRAGHDDAFVLPIGWGDEPWSPELTRGRDALDVEAALAAHGHLRGVPVTVDLRHGSGLAFVGPPREIRDAARAVIAAATALHGPADLSVVVYADATAARDWEWVKWLPHGPGGRARLVTDPAPGGERPWPEPGDDARPGASSGPVTLVVADGPVWWHGRHAALRAALARADIRLLALVEQDQLVPAVCTTVVGVTAAARATVHHVPSATLRTAVVVNRLELDLAVAAARRLGRLDDPERTAPGAGEVGVTVRLLEELALDPLSVDAVRRRWSDPARRPATPLGVNAAGPVTVDLVTDGPHALIAGTTGSGKSELLRTLVAGLAATLPPTELNVVLVDFKGGAAFDACARLPHTVGIVTDLDEHLAGRMLRSLRAEVTHRERQLRDAGAGSLDDLIARNGRASMPRLLIVIDEFAALAEQLPDFVPNLVDIAQRGRSLGVHLVLATQRPSGVVDAKIRANTNLRIALRVHDDADSFDVIGARDAVALPRHQPGRAVARFGAGELVDVQTALATAVTPVEPRPAVRVTPHVMARPLSALEGRLAGRARPDPDLGSGPTDLDRLVEAIVVAAGSATPRRPCLDPLPSCVRAHELPTHAALERPGVPLALVDRPDEQRWSVRTWQAGGSGSLGLIGTTGSGTTSTLLTLALGVAATTSPDDVHLYVIDADAGRLAPLARLPHVGAVIGPQDPARIARLLRHLGAEIDRRRVAVALDRPPGPPEPPIVLVIDNIGSLRQALDDDRRSREVWPTVERVAREGIGVGVTMVVTASHERGLPAAVAAHLTDRLVLRLPERSAYAAFGLRPRDVAELGPGRAIDPATGLEHQLLAPPADLAGAVEAVVDRWPAARRPPRPVEPLPARLLAGDVIGRAVTRRDGWALPIGLDERDGDIVALPVRPGQVVAVYGPPGSGRTTTLRTLLAGLHRLDAGIARYAIGPRPGLADLAVGPARPAEVPGWVDAVLGDPRRRVVVVDDADELDGPSLVRLATQRGRDVALVLAGNPDRLREPAHWARPVARTRTGVLLGATAGEGDLLRVTVTGVSEPPGAGRGHAVVDGVLIPVLLADGGPSAQGGPP